MDPRRQTGSVRAARLGPLPLDPASRTPLADVTRAVRWRCAAWRTALERARRFAPVPTPVLLHGETGTGKSAFAEIVHAESGRAGEPLARINCAALAPELLAAELFGHVRGAFTGAEQDRPGLLRAAGRGTVLLDEIDKASPALQGALLQVLDSGEARPVGSTVPFRVRARLLFATNRPLRPAPSGGDARATGTILPDLHYRIAALAVHVPPVRRRREDLDLLVALALRDLRRDGLPALAVDAEAFGLLAAHDWPGNVRELAGTVRAAALLRRVPDRIDAAAIRDAADGTPLARPLARATDPADLASKLRHLEREEILLALRVEAGNQARAARRLGLSRRGLNKKIHRHDLAAALEREALADFRRRR